VLISLGFLLSTVACPHVSMRKSSVFLSCYAYRCLFKALRPKIRY